LYLLGEQPARTRNPRRTVEDVARPPQLPLAGIALGKPEGACEEGALLARQSVVALVATNEAAFAEHLLERGGGPHHPLVVELDEAEHRQQQRRRVELGLVEALDEDAAILVVAASFDRL